MAEVHVEIRIIPEEGNQQGQQFHVRLGNLSLNILGMSIPSGLAGFIQHQREKLLPLVRGEKTVLHLRVPWESIMGKAQEILHRFEVIQR